MNEIVVKVETDGWWTWECKTHGKAAFLHKTKKDAEIEAAQHNESHAFSSRTKVDIWAMPEKWSESLERIEESE